MQQDLHVNIVRLVVQRNVLIGDDKGPARAISCKYLPTCLRIQVCHEAGDAGFLKERVQICFMARISPAAEVDIAIAANIHR